jgi:hypothetical protein
MIMALEVVASIYILPQNQCVLGDSFFSCQMHIHGVSCHTMLATLQNESQYHYYNIVVPNTHLAKF